jgi:hypothetical protein
LFTVVVAACLGLATLTALPPSAAAASPGRGDAADPAVAAALQRIAAGTSTASDLALISGRPELAKVVADPSRTTITRTSSAGTQDLLAGRKPAGGAGVSGIEYCGNWIEVTVTVYTVLGFVLFRWMHHAGYCIDYDVGVVTRWESRYDRLIEADPTIIFLGVTADSASPVPSSPAVSTMQRHLQQCILTYGCWANWYPWAQTYAWGNGSWGFRGGA